MIHENPIIFWKLVIGNIFYNFTISKLAEIITIIFLIEILFKQITIFEDFLLIVETGNNRVVKTNFPENISQDLWKSNNF